MSAEFEHKHTDTHTLRHSGACRCSRGAISFLASLLTLASLMVVNASAEHFELCSLVSLL